MIGISGIRRRWHRQEQAVEDVKEFGPELKVVSFFYSEVPRKARIFRGLPLPAVVVQERCSGAPLSRAVVRPGLRIQNLRGLRVEASAVGILVKQRLSGHVILEVVTETAGKSSGISAQLGAKIIIRRGNFNQRAAAGR